MLMLRLAFRNMLAHGQRSRTLFLSVGLVGCFVFLFMSFSDGEIKNFRDGVRPITQPPSDILVTREGYRDAVNAEEDWKEVARKTIPGASGVFKELLREPGVAEAALTTPLVTFDIISAGQRYKDFEFRAYSQAHQWQVRPYINLKEGSWPDDSDIPQILLHYKSAGNVGVKTGDKVVLTGHDIFGQVVSLQVTVKGYYIPGQDEPHLPSFGFMNMAAYNSIAGFNPDETVEIALKLAPGVDVDKTIANLEKISLTKSAKLVYEKQESVRKSDGGVYESMRLVFLAISLLIILIVALGVMSVVSVNLFDRKREIGTYYCIGSEKGFLRGLYIFEVLFINVLATVGGISAGLVLREVINGMAIRTDAPGLQMVFGGSQFTLGLSLDSVVLLVVLVPGVTLMASLMTINKRLRVSPVVALKDTE